MKENVTFEEVGDTLIARLYGEIDHHTAKAARESIDRETRARCPGVLELDFGEVPFMDSSGVGLILGRSETVKAVGGVLRLVGLRYELLRIVKLSGLEKIAGLTVVLPEGGALKR